MAAAAAALLDELMGRNRNAGPNEKGVELNWEDPEVMLHILCVSNDWLVPHAVYSTFLYLTDILMFLLEIHLNIMASPLKKFTDASVWYVDFWP